MKFVFVHTAQFASSEGPPHTFSSPASLLLFFPTFPFIRDPFLYVCQVAQLLSVYVGQALAIAVDSSPKAGLFFDSGILEKQIPPQLLSSPTPTFLLYFLNRGRHTAFCSASTRGTDTQSLGGYRGRRS